MNETELVPLLEALYAFDVDDESWLQSVLLATMGLCGSEHTYSGFFYDASDVEASRVWNVCAIDLPPELERSFETFRERVTEPALVKTMLRSLYVGSARRAGLPHVGSVLAERERLGWGDLFSINGLDPCGIGCSLTIGVRESEFTASQSDLAVYKRIAHHVAAAFRCRRRLGTTPSPQRHASGDDAEDKGPRATARERIRTPPPPADVLRSNRRATGRYAIDPWNPFVGARWTLVDSFEENGKRLVLACENGSRSSVFDTLTDRERQVVLQAALGSTTKEIAYALGVSDSTVRVLLARAVNRVGVRSRAELLSHPSLRDLGGLEPRLRESREREEAPPPSHA